MNDATALTLLALDFDGDLLQLLLFAALVLGSAIAGAVKKARENASRQSPPDRTRRPPQRQETLDDPARRRAEDSHGLRLPPGMRGNSPGETAQSRASGQSDARQAAESQRAAAQQARREAARQQAQQRQAARQQAIQQKAQRQQDRRQGSASRKKTPAARTAEDALKPISRANKARSSIVSRGLLGSTGSLGAQAGSASPESRGVEVDLKGRTRLQQAMIYHEIFSPPKALRDPGQR
jgi:hypothetical protein